MVLPFIQSAIHVSAELMKIVRTVLKMLVLRLVNTLHN